MHEALALFIGDWTGEEDIAASPWGEAATVRSRHSFRSAVEGLAVVQDYAQDRPDGKPFSGHGFWAVDPASGEVFWYFFDSVGLPPEQPVRGTWDGSALTMTKRTSRGIARHEFRFREGGFEHDIDVRLGEATTFSAFVRARYQRG